jgi:hypothetical protein
MSTLAREIIELNIAYYREKLQTETDPSKCGMIAKWLKEQEIKLVRLGRSVSRDKAPPSRPSRANETD